MKGSLLELEEDVGKASAHCAGDGETRPPETGSGWLVGRTCCRAVWQDETYLRARLGRAVKSLMTHERACIFILQVWDFFFFKLRRAVRSGCFSFVCFN